MRSVEELDKKLIEKVARISRACDMRLLGYPQEPEEGTTEGLDFEKAGDIIKTVAQEIKNMKMPDTLPGKPLSGYEMMFRRRHDIKVQRDYGRAVRKAILDLMETDNV